MHSSSVLPVLTVDEARMRSFDPQSLDDLSLMWSVFSKASRVMENGERLKNLSWRLWNRETLCCHPRRLSRSKAVAIQRRSDSLDSETQPLPSLSGSVDSSSSEDLDASTNLSSESFAHHDTTNTSRSDPKDRHIGPVDLAQLVHSINETQDLTAPISPLVKPLHNTSESSETFPCLPTDAMSPRPVNTDSSTSTVATVTDSFTSIGASSDSSATSEGSSHSVVRGFTPGSGVTTYTSKSQLAPTPVPILKNSTARLNDSDKKKNGMFMLGASSEEDESFRERMSVRSRPSMASTTSRHTSNNSKKQTSFKEEVLVMRDTQSQRKPAPVFESDDEDESASETDEVSESAIDDGDSDEWEDDESDTKDDKSELKFYRVDSQANLASRRSLLTLNLEEQRAGKLPNSRSTPALRRSRTSTPNGPSMPASPTEESPLEMRAAHPKNSQPIIRTTSNSQPAPLTSPRTNRRNMLVGELSESLRLNMLSERQQKNPLHVAPMKRAHTSSDVTRLSRVPEVNEKPVERPSMSTEQPAKQVSWNHYFNEGTGSYYESGW